jgi:hypothetical protein
LKHNRHSEIEAISSNVPKMDWFFLVVFILNTGGGAGGGADADIGDDPTTAPAAAGDVAGVVDLDRFVRDMMLHDFWSFISIVCGILLGRWQARACR